MKFINHLKLIDQARGGRSQGRCQGGLGRDPLEPGSVLGARGLESSLQ